MNKYDVPLLLCIFEPGIPNGVSDYVDDVLFVVLYVLQKFGDDHVVEGKSFFRQFPASYHGF